MRSTDPVARALLERFPDFTTDTGWQAAETIYPARAAADYLDLIKKPDPTDPVFCQVAPSAEELDDAGSDDPARETSSQAAPRLLHRYPDRVLLLTCSECFVRCRHCMRKRLWKERFQADRAAVESWRSYVAAHPEVREVILSGGDPLTLKDDDLEALLAAIRSVPTVETVRVHSRAVAAAPSRIDDRLAAQLYRGGVRRLVTQFNHPAELSAGAAQAALRLMDQGIEVLNQSVLLRGVNDRPEVLAELWRVLVKMQVKSYYLHHPDRARGAMHFTMSLERGLSIYRAAAELSEVGAAPAYVVDVPGSAKIEVARLVEEGAASSVQAETFLPVSL